MKQPPLGRLLGIAGRMTAARFQRLLESQGMTHAGWQVLLALTETDGLTQREVAERCYVTPATVTGVVDTLERDGLVTRVRGADDRRVVKVCLTDEGRARLARTKREAARQMDAVFGDLSARDEAVVRRFLDRTIERLQEDGR
ncbi:MAG TPA: MarR family transcriptional regulator [Frankiaceae bacterium]|nr:MarR family transcriptional regulator [Frankiaceae bacterium]